MSDTPRTVAHQVHVSTIDEDAQVFSEVLHLLSDRHLTDDEVRDELARLLDDAELTWTTIPELDDDVWDGSLFTPAHLDRDRWMDTAEPVPSLTQPWGRTELVFLDV